MKYTEEQVVKLHEYLTSKGYRKFHQSFHNSHYQFWKSFEIGYDEEGYQYKGYQIGIAFYDYSKYPAIPIHENKTVAISFNFLLGSHYNVDRLDLSISDERMNVDEFENFCNNLYHSEVIQKLKTRF